MDVWLSGGRVITSQRRGGPRRRDGRYGVCELDMRREGRVHRMQHVLGRGRAPAAALLACRGAGGVGSALSSEHDQRVSGADGGVRGDGPPDGGRRLADGGQRRGGVGDVRGGQATLLALCVRGRRRRFTRDGHAPVARFKPSPDHPRCIPVRDRQRLLLDNPSSPLSAALALLRRRRARHSRRPLNIVRRLYVSAA